MPKIESYKQGTPSWVDLSTSDQAAAKDFYAMLFGWQYEDNDAGNGMIYSMAQIDGFSRRCHRSSAARRSSAGHTPTLERLHHRR